MFSLEQSRVVIAEDISGTGARLTGPELPKKGEDIWIRVGPIDAFGTVVWSEGGECGITFEKPLGPNETAFAEAEGRLLNLTKLTPLERSALADWRGGQIN
jgi:hypothetical protein